jgi:hypothetical protein
VPWLRRLVAGLPPRRPEFDPGSVHVGFVVDKVALGQVFSPSSSVFPSVSFHRCSITRKRTKNNNHHHLHHRVAQEASRLWCVRSVCCGALHHSKKSPHGRVDGGFSSPVYDSVQTGTSVPTILINLLSSSGTSRTYSRRHPAPSIFCCLYLIHRKTKVVRREGFCKEAAVTPCLLSAPCSAEWRIHTDV